MQSKLFTSIVRTLCYAHVFRYPLRADEIHTYLISDTPYSYSAVRSELSKLRYPLNRKGAYFYLEPFRETVGRRLKLYKINHAKMIKAKRISKILSLIPTVRFIGVSGSLSMHNAEGGDDIDLFIVTKSETVWITRFFITLLLLICGEKRPRNGSVTKDKICPNMFVSEDALGIVMKERNVYSAHEVVQVKVLVDKGNIFEKFLFENRWVRDFLPNSFAKQKKQAKNLPATEQTTAIKIIGKICSFVDRISFFLQYRYMFPHKTGETIEKDIAQFYSTRSKTRTLIHYKIYCQKMINIISTQKIEEKPLKRYSPGSTSIVILGY